MTPLVGAALISVMGCSRWPSEDLPPPRPARPARVVASAPRPSLSELADAGPSRRLPSEKTLREIARIRQRAVGVTPARVPGQTIAFAGHRLAFIAGQSVRVESLSKPPFAGASPKESLVIPLTEPHRLVTLVGDLLLAVGSRQSLALPIDRTSPRALSHVTLLGETLMLTDPRWRDALTTFLPATGTLFTYVIEDPSATGILLPRTQIDASGLGPLLCGVMRDGALVCGGTSEVHRSYPGLALRHIGTLRPGAEPFRILPGSRADRFLLARANGELEEYSMVGALTWVSATTLPPSPYDIAEGASMLGVLSFEEDSRDTRLPRVSILSSDGATRFARTLVAQPPRRTPDGDTTALSTSRWEIALHPRRPWVAVRSPSHVVVLDYTSGQTIFESDAPASSLP